jgi:hypothetical protein
MRRRSVTGPLLLLAIGGLFLWRNLHPEAPIFDIVARYWPFVLIIWGFMRLIESLIWRSRGYRGGFSGGEVVLIVFICLIGAGMSEARQHGVHFAIRGLDIWGQQYDYPITARGSAAGMKRVVFENQRGNIKVIGSDLQDIEITGRKLVRSYSKIDADKADSNTPVEIVPQGDHLLVRTNQERISGNQRLSHDLEVVVPRGVALEFRASNGDYDVSDIAGEVNIHSDRGDVRLTRIGGNVRLEIDRSELIRANDVKGGIELTGDGSDIEFENVAGQVNVTGAYRGTLDFKNLAKPLIFEGSRNTELHVQAVPGRISMDLGAFNASNIVGPVRLITRSRDIKVDQFSESLDIETERGDIELTPGRAPNGAIDARSGSGRIALVLPAKANFQLTAVAEAGDAVNDFGPVIQKEVSGRTATLTGNVGSGPTIRLKAGRGWVSVRKEGAPSTLPPIAPEAPKPPDSPDSKGTEI